MNGKTRGSGETHALIEAMLAHELALSFVEDFGGSRRWLLQGQALAEACIEAEQRQAYLRADLLRWRRELDALLRRALRSQPHLRRELRAAAQNVNKPEKTIPQILRSRNNELPEGGKHENTTRND